MNEKQLRNHKKRKKKRTYKACKTTVIDFYISNANFWRSCRRRRCGYLSSLLCRVALLSARSSGFRITCKTWGFLFPSKIALFSQVPTVFLICSLFNISAYHFPQTIDVTTEKQVSLITENYGKLVPFYFTKITTIWAHYFDYLLQFTCFFENANCL